MKGREICIGFGKENRRVKGEENKEAIEADVND